jgi:hypothetical protein
MQHEPKIDTQTHLDSNLGADSPLDIPPLRVEAPPVSRPDLADPDPEPDPELRPEPEISVDDSPVAPPVLPGH